MSFDAAWLDLREPVDHTARDAGLLRAFAEGLPDAPRIVDLGSGTGSTMRAVSVVRPDAVWRLTDNDPLLLAEAKRRAPAVKTMQVDLAHDLARALSGPSDAITASALVDLVSAEWLDRLVALADGRMLYIALSYDGSEQWTPEHSDDAEVFAAFEAHQRGDKGFGPALGADAVPYLSKALRAAGYDVQTAPSPWVVEAGPLMVELANGIAGAAVEAGLPPETATSWKKSRKSCNLCSVGHIDLLAQIRPRTL